MSLPTFPPAVVADAIRHGDPGPRSRAIGLVWAATEASAVAGHLDRNWETAGYLKSWVAEVATA
jgi:hypothetical protein